MIISQTIRNGLCIVNKTGSYFQLISASGIVNVTLNLAGRTVLNSKMWVGMNLDKAMPYDEIVITAEQDGAIEFWAGDVSMQLFAFSNDAARSIKTSAVYVSGETLLTDANFIRKALRIRASDTVAIGGAGFQRWTVNQGETVEIPIAGSVFAYAQRFDIDVADYEAVLTAGAYPSPFSMLFQNISEDGNYRLAVGYTFCGVSENTGSGWVEHPDFEGSYNAATNLGHYYWGVRDFNGDIWVSVSGGALSETPIELWVSKDEGRTFDRKYLVDRPDNYSPSGGDNIMSASNGIITLASSSHAIVINAETGESMVFPKPIDSANYKFFAAKMGLWYRIEDAQSGYKRLLVSDDYGNKWSEVITDITNDVKYSVTGKQISVKKWLGGEQLFSYDGGSTWVGSGRNDVKTWHLSGEMWVILKNRVLYLVRVNADGYHEDVICSDIDSIDYLVLSVSGNIYARFGTNQVTLETVNSGRVLPVVVEVMELLA